MRMITVYVDLIGPLYWWKEFDTYKVGTVANSCSTMHKIAEKEFTLEDFSHEHLINSPLVESAPGKPELLNMQAISMLEVTIGVLNAARFNYLQTQDKKYWWQMIQLLPSSYNQKRTVMLNYEVLANIYKSRRNHKLDEWHTFCEKCQFYRYSKYAKIEHLVDITCWWDIEELGGDRIYAIGPGFTREDLTPYELYLMEKSESIKRG